MLIFLLVIFAIIIIFKLNSYLSKKAQKKFIYQKYDPKIAERIWKKTIWIGETKEQLLDSLGNPIDIDENVLKTKRREKWKYYRMGTNRYGLKIIVENDVVIGWDEKM